MLDTASKIVALIVATIGAATTIFDIFFKGDRGRKQAYYDCILKPFAVAYKKDSSISAIEFVKSSVDSDNDNIPKYVFYLIDTQITPGDDSPCRQNDDVLKKVLIEDYLNLYPNVNNKKRNLFETVHKLLDYLMFLLLFLFVFMGALVMTSGAMTLITLFFAEMRPSLADCWNGIKEMLVGIAISLLGLIPVKLSEWLSKDMYAVKKSHIQKMINKRTRNYDRSFDDYII